jgi:hypothetical protein
MPYKNPEDRKASCRAYYLKNLEKLKKQRHEKYHFGERGDLARELEKSRYRSRREIIRQIKENTSCVDCGSRFPHYVLEFDHAHGEKEFNIGSTTGMSIARLMQEMAKCDVVCANCHRIREWHRKSQDGSRRKKAGRPRRYPKRPQTKGELMKGAKTIEVEVPEVSALPLDPASLLK